MNIPNEIYEKVIDTYQPDVLHRLLALLELRNRLRAEGRDLKNRLLDWHDENVRQEFLKT